MMAGGRQDGLELEVAYCVGGVTTPPCGAPVTLPRTTPCSITPARSIARSSFNRLRSLIRSSTACTNPSCGIDSKDGRLSASNSDELRAAMTAKLTSDDGKACYGKRKETIEPVFGQIKDGRGARRFTRRGLTACQAEWKLLCGTHNLLKLWRHTVMRPAATPATT
jgi:Transposase DDE domain